MADFEVSKASSFIQSALNARALRQDMISSNIANVDTPGYRPRDISFENVLKKESNRVFNNEKEKKLDIAQTNSMHLSSMDEEINKKSTLFFRDGHLARNDGNSVDIDVETSEMAKNSTMYQALISAYKKDQAIFSAVIDASKSVQ